jgi:thioredoxin reductase
MEAFNYQALVTAISFFLVVVVVFPFVLKEIRKKKEARKLINRIVPVHGLTDRDLERIETLHPEGKKLHPAINTSICVGCNTCVLSCKEKGALYLIDGKSILVDPFACKSRGDCEKQCPTGALQLVEYGQRMKIKIPETGDHYQSSIPGIYIVGALTGAGLIKEAINQGRAAVNHIMRDVFPDNLPRVAVVGAGPAGLSAFLSCRKFGLPAFCLEKDKTANTIRNFPKKKILMAEPVDMPIYGPLWVGDTTREKLLEAWDRILEKTGVTITTGAQMEHIEGKDGDFTIHAGSKQYHCHKVILALGNRGVPRKLNVPGEEDNENLYYNLLDAEDFAGSDVTVSGAGDSAVEAALSLRQQDCRVRMVVRGDGFPRVKAKNREKILRAIEDNEVIAHFNSRITAFENAHLSIEDDASRIARYKSSAHFVMIGGEPPFQLLEKLGIVITEKEI